MIKVNLENARVLSKTKDPDGNGRNFYYSVEIHPQAIVDVMCVIEHGELEYAYVMKCHDGGTVYSLDSKGKSIGNVEDYGLTQSDLKEFAEYVYLYHS